MPCLGDAGATCGQSTWPGSEASCQWPVRKPLLQPQFSLLVTGSSAEVLPEIPGETLNWNQLRAALGFLTHILCEQAELL